MSDDALSATEVLREEYEALMGSSTTEQEDVYRSLMDARLSALCLSGGGIRSSSFCFGVLQALFVDSSDRSARVLPKGRIEPYERPMDAAVREIREEGT